MNLNTPITTVECFNEITITITITDKNFNYSNNYEIFITSDYNSVCAHHAINKYRPSNRISNFCWSNFVDILCPHFQLESDNCPYWLNCDHIIHNFCILPHSNCPFPSSSRVALSVVFVSVCRMPAMRWSVRLKRWCTRLRGERATPRETWTKTTWTPLQVQLQRRPAAEWCPAWHRWVLIDWLIGQGLTSH